MRRNLALDGLRGIAALSVMLFHLATFGLYPFRAENHLVDLFFVMSGYVVAGAYEANLPQIGWRRFMVVRLRRLYPVYALSLLIAAAFSLFMLVVFRVTEGASASGVSLVFQAIYLPTPPGLVPPHRSAFLLNGPAWSLFWELAVNAAYAAALPFLTARRLLAIVAAAGLAVIALAVAGFDLSGGSDWPSWWMGGVRVLFGFPLGVLLYRLPRPRWNTPFVVLAVLVVASLALPGPVSMLLVLPACVWLATASASGGRGLRWLGDLSYPLYAVHEPMFEWAMWVGHRVLRLDGMALGLFMAVVAIAGAVAVTMVFEPVVRRRTATRAQRGQAIGKNGGRGPPHSVGQ